MRKHEAEPYTILPRARDDGSVIFYYRARRPDGTRTCAWSTGETTPEAAENYCKKLLKAGTLIQAPSWGMKKNGDAPKHPKTFGDLARGFWDWDGKYIAARLEFSDPKKPAVSKRYARDMQRILDLHITPAFGRLHFETISPQTIEAFSLRLRDGGLSGKRVNNVVSCLRVMLSEAKRSGLIAWDPKEKGIVRTLGNAPKHRGRLTAEEVRKLFAEENIKTAWKGHTLYRAVNLTAAATGCRQGELLALRDCDVFPDYLHIEHSYDIKFGLGPTKTRRARDVPVPSKIHETIKPFLGSGGFVFSMSGGKSPCTGNRVTAALYDALDSIGVKDRAERNITFHSWRHWLNSVLRAAAVPDDIVRKVTGHETAEMTENYTEYLADDYAPVAVVQQRIFG